MTIDELITELEKYYGEYENKYLKGSVRAYILKDYKPANYPEIRRSIQYYHKANFGAPCIATIEDCIKSARLEKGQTDPHKGVVTKNRWDYKEQAKTNPEFDNVNENLTDLFKQTIKKVN